MMHAYLKGDASAQGPVECEGPWLGVANAANVQKVIISEDPALPQAIQEVMLAATWPHLLCWAVQYQPAQYR